MPSPRFMRTHCLPKFLPLEVSTDDPKAKVVILCNGLIFYKSYSKFYKISIILTTTMTTTAAAAAITTTTTTSTTATNTTTTTTTVIVSQFYSHFSPAYCKTTSYSKPDHFLILTTYRQSCFMKYLNLFYDEVNSLLLVLFMCSVGIRSISEVQMILNRDLGPVL